MGVAIGDNRNKGRRAKRSVTYRAYYLENAEVNAGADEQWERATGKGTPAGGCRVTQLKSPMYKVGIAAAASEKMANASS